MKFTEWSVIIIVMIIFLEIMGVGTGLSAIASKFGLTINDNGAVDGSYNENIGWFAEILAIFAVVTVGGAVVIGLFAKSYDTSLVIAPLILATLSLLGSTAFSIMMIPEIASQVWMRNIIGIIFGGMGVAFLWSSVDYFAGR